MYYESIRTLLEEEFANNKFSEEQKYCGLDLLNKLSEHFDKLTSCKPIYLVAALAFFVLADSGQVKNFKELGDDFGIEAKTVALKAKEIIPFLGIADPEEVLRKGLFASQTQAGRVERTEVADKTGIVAALKKAIPEEILKSKRNLNEKAELKDPELIEIFKQFRLFTALLFKDKDFIEIKQYLRLLELNLFMSGYDIKNLDMEKKFGELFIYLGFEPKKGREAEKFVRLKDRFGQSEPYTLIKLGE